MRSRAFAREERSMDVGVATNRKFTADDGPLIARMNAALGRANLTPRHRKLLHFALGKAHDDMGNYKEAMRNFEAGNRYRALGGRLERGCSARYIDRVIEATPPGYRDRQPDRGVEDATPILIVGMPRSGTTLTEQILSSHPEIAAAGERDVLGRALRGSRRHLGADVHSGGDAAPRRRLSRGAAAVRAGREAGHGQDARQFHAARRHPPRLPQRDPHPLPAPSDRHRSVHLHHQFRE